MLTERTLWLGATTVTIGLLLLMIFQPRPERRDRPTSRFDEPDSGAMAVAPPCNSPPSRRLTSVHSIVVDPDDPRRLSLTTDLGVIVSSDGGQTWMSAETEVGPAVTKASRHASVIGNGVSGS